MGYFDVFRHEMESPDAQKFFAKCCDVPPTPPKGKKYILKKKIIKRKRLKAKTTVNLDFLNSNNKDQRNKFEAAFIKRAKAKSGTFTYKKVAKSNRRHLTQGTEVSATLEFEDDEAADAGEAAVTATNFATQVSQDLLDEGVTISLTKPSASIELADEEVVEQVLVDDDGAISNGVTTSAATSNGVTTSAETTKQGVVLLSTGSLLNPIAAFPITLIAI